MNFQNSHQLWENQAQKFITSFQNLETLNKFSDYHKTPVNLC